MRKRKTRVERRESDAALRARVLTLFIGQIQEAENTAHRLGLTITGHGLNNAKNAAGWEIAGNLIAAGKAARGERVGEKTR